MILKIKSLHLATVCLYTPVPKEMDTDLIYLFKPWICVYNSITELTINGKFDNRRRLKSVRLRNVLQRLFRSDRANRRSKSTFLSPPLHTLRPIDNDITFIEIPQMELKRDEGGGTVRGL
jgi:hypothetical protein